MNNKELLSKLKFGEYYIYSAIKEYPLTTVRQLSDSTNMSKRALYRHLKSLMKLGFIKEYDSLNAYRGQYPAKRYGVIV